MEFECTNNVAEYETLVQGLKKAMDLHVICIEVFRDSQIFAHQVTNSINCTSNHLKNYQQEVLELINIFEAFNIRSIPRSMNSEVDMLANVASNLCPSDDLSHNKFSVKSIYRPSILDLDWEFQVKKYM